MHHVTIYHSDTAAVFSLNDQGLKTYVAKLKKANMLEPLKNIYMNYRRNGDHKNDKLC